MPGTQARPDLVPMIIGTNKADNWVLHCVLQLTMAQGRINGGPYRCAEILF